MLIHPPIPIEIISIGPLSIRWYSIMYIFGFLFFFWWTKREILSDRIVIAKNLKSDDSVEILSDLLFYMMMGLIIGGRLGYVFLYNPQYYFLEDPLAILRPWEGGMSFHGAFVGTYIAAILGIYKLRNRIATFNVLDLSDIVLISVPFGLACGRFGNFINGELYGRPTAVPWGMLFPRRPEFGHSGAKLLPIEQVQTIIDTANLQLEQNVTEFIINGQSYIQIPRHPSQLYHVFLEGLLTLAIQMIFYYKVPVAKYRGFLTGSFLISYGCSRVFTEFFREPDFHIGFLWGEWLTAGMLYSIPMILIGIVLVVCSIRRKEINRIRVESCQQSKS
ncbi:MAG: prolipoprotein diacylglyceryl transferase [Brevinema sp.]